MVLYLISVGLSITMGLMGFVNLAHGVFAMAGGYVTVTLMNKYGVPFFAALAGAFVVAALLGLVLERTLYARLYGTSDFDQVLFSIGLIFVSIAVVRHFWGPLTQPMRVPAYLKGVVSILGLVAASASGTPGAFTIVSGAGVTIGLGVAGLLSSYYFTRFSRSWDLRLEETARAEERLKSAMEMETE